MDVIILAGGLCDDDLADCAGVKERWALPVDGEPVFYRVRRAFPAEGARIISVGGPPSDERVEPGDTYLQSLRRGLEASESEWILLCTADLPDLTPEDVQAFLRLTHDGADLFYPIVDAKACGRDYPGMKRTILRMRDGDWTGGNLALVRRAVLLQCLPHVEKLYAARKSPLALAGILGLGVLWKVLMLKFRPGSSNVEDLERAVSKAMGLRIRAVRTDRTSIGTDIDSGPQYQAYLAMKSGSSNVESP